jgi:hypothetical protein
VSSLVVEDNPGLSGCVPLVKATVFWRKNPNISGLCNCKATALHVQQREALALLPTLVLGYGDFNDTLRGLLHQTTMLGNLVGDSDTNLTLQENFNEGLGGSTSSLR